MRAWIATFLLIPVTLLALACGSTPVELPDAGSPGSGASNNNTGGSGSGSGAAGSNSGGSGLIISTDGGPVDNPCEAEEAPEDCELRPSGPACGDGELNQDFEVCDDHNTMLGDGCSGTCAIEPFFECPTPGQPCVSTIICGDGLLGPGEACDDANTVDGDGCNATCRIVEIGYACRTPGMPCTRVYVCGDGRVDPNEGCDDGALLAGDGCSERCKIEIGFKCDGVPSTCSATTCGDMVTEGAESCDDGNAIPFDGCSAACQAEPTCPQNGACTSGCGDGIVFEGEGCDDANLRPGDGCSADCQVEDGFMCSNDATCVSTDTALCSITVPAVFRDFNARTATGGHPDFQPGVNSPGVTEGLVQPEWDEDKKPVQSAAATQANGFMHGQPAFSQWYRDEAPAKPFPSSIVLWDNGDGGFVNRFGPNGEQWVAWPQSGQIIDGVTYPNPMVCGQTCADAQCATPNMPPPEGAVCLEGCLPFGPNDMQACYAVPAYMDGNPLFFPLDHIEGTLDEPRMSAKIPEQYGFTGWPWEYAFGDALGLTPSGVTCATPPAMVPAGWADSCHNFSFTTEVKYWFKFDPATPATLDFTGDDDVWVFVNGHLAVDLGGWHVPVSGSVTLSAATAATYGLEEGGVYQIGVFHAERQVEGSSFKLTLSGFNLAPSDCRTNCGDGEVAAGEECDDGPLNQGGYNQCTPTCNLGPRCGDGVVQMDYGEVCDEGPGGNTGAYGTCAATCVAGPHCGDGIVTDAEPCDDGVNDGGYGECFPGCVIGPYCGDGQRDLPYEECDDGNAEDQDGCTPACVLEVVVPK
jgi:fibro-slime domain-containing protein